MRWTDRNWSCDTTPCGWSLWSRSAGLPGERVLIETHWWLQLTDDKAVPEGTSVARVTVQGGPQDYDAVVAAEAAGLAEIGAELARVIERQAADSATP